MNKKRFASENLPPEVQAKAERMNLDKNAIGSYMLPSLPYNAQTTLEEFQKIRPQLLKPFVHHMYGSIPPKCEEVCFNVTSEADAFCGLALRREIDIVCRHRGMERVLHMLLYIPADCGKKVPVFLGLNFNGNVAATTDPGATFLPFDRYPDTGTPRYNDKRADEKARGLDAYRWQFERVLKKGFAVATMCYYDIYPDRPDGFQNSIMRMFYSVEEWNSPMRETGAISAWAWGIMRAVDCLSGQTELDSDKIAVHGHSRLGKAALWGGANDTRIALVASNCSGTLGAKMAHRNFGENYEWINHWNPHWTRASFSQYSGRDAEFPVDQHFLMASIAPRLLYVASATCDDYADPEGEFLSTVSASEAWSIFSRTGLAERTFPVPGKLIASDGIGYYLRDGQHDFTWENWDVLLNFALTRI